MPTVSKKQVGIEARRKTTSGRFYEIEPGNPYPSITNILGVINKPALVGWAGKVERIACIEAAIRLHSDWENLTESTIDAYRSTLESYIGKQKAAQKELEAAAAIGTEAHARCEWLVRSALNLPVGPEPKVSEKALWASMAFEDWWKKVNFKPIRSEQVVFSRIHKFAGTLDILGYVDGLLTIVDIKTGKAIYSEAYLQIAAYWRALQETTQDYAARGIVLRLPKIDTDPEFEAVPVDDLEMHLLAFLHAAELWRWQYAQDQAYKAKMETA